MALVVDLTSLDASSGATDVGSVLSLPPMTLKQGDVSRSLL